MSSGHSSKFKFFCSTCFPKKITNVLESYQDEIDYKIHDQKTCDRDILLENVKECDALICAPYDRIDKQLLDNSPKLKFISTFSIGYEHIDLNECFKRNIRITTSPYFGAGTMHEFTIGLMIDLARNITLSSNKTRAIDWKPLKTDLYWFSGVGLKDSIVGIVGLGSIGLGIAKRLIGFEVNKILYHNRSRNEQGDKLGFEYASFDTLLKESDFIVCSCSINKQSEGLFNKNAFDKMKSNAIFVNVSRGAAVNQDDLYDALKNGKILAAGLDVTTPQPLPADHKLYSLDNCLITPYIAWAETRTTDRRVSHALNNVLNFYFERDLVNELKYPEQLK